MGIYPWVDNPIRADKHWNLAPLFDILFRILTNCITCRVLVFSIPTMHNIGDQIKNANITPISKNGFPSKILHTSTRLPPISRTSPIKLSSLTPSLVNARLPAIVFRHDYMLRPKQSLTDYLSLDLSTPRLNNIHQHLWLAGLPSAARPLHRQKLLGRSLLITENPDEHLVWVEKQSSIKPLPLYLLNYDYWAAHLCHSEDLYQSACGLLYSYAWLICHECDLDIAKDTALLPRDIEWSDWVVFMDIFLDHIDLVTLSDMNKRYQYGELRLTRLNTIYRFMPPSHSMRNFVHGYRAESTWYGAYFGRHFRWLLALFAIVSVTLSALQVGLATSALQDSRNFVNAAYGFTITALIIIATCVVALCFTWFVLFWYHLLSSCLNDKRTRRKRRTETVVV